MDLETGKEIKKAVIRWLECSGMMQKELAEKLDMSSPALNQMLNTEKGLPLSRFLQIVHILRVEQSEIDRVFGLYCADLNLPHGALRLSRGAAHTASGSNAARQRIHSLVDRLDEKHYPTVEMMLNGLVG